jgi:hypothetical protein
MVRGPSPGAWLEVMTMLPSGRRSTLMSGPFIGKGLNGAVLGSRAAIRASAPSISLSPGRLSLFSQSVPRLTLA